MDDRWIVDEIHKMIRREFMSKHGKILSFEDLSSAAMYWLSSKGRLESLKEIYRTGGELNFYEYVRSCLSRIFVRDRRDEVFRYIHERPLSIMDAGVNSSPGISFPLFEDMMMIPESAERILKIAASFPIITEKQLEAMKLAYVAGMTAKEAAEHLGIKPGAFYDRKGKGMMNLFLALHGNDVDPGGAAQASERSEGF